MANITLSDEIFSIIKQAGTEKVFLVPGGGNMFLVDSAGSQEGIEVVPTHHEQAAVISAEYYSRISGKLGVALVTTGPGSTNAVTGIAGAWLDSVPLLVLAGQVKTSDYNFNSVLRQKGPQEVDFVSMVKNITKYSETCTTQENCLEYLRTAMFEATSGRPGPAVLEIPLDIQSLLLSKDLSHASDNNSNQSEKVVIESQYQQKIFCRQLIANLKKAERPLFVIGNGVKASRCFNKVRELVRSINVPVCLTWPTIDFLPFDDELNAGRFGNVAKRFANILIQKSDLIIVLGSRLDPVLTAYNIDRFGKNAKVMVVDIDWAELEKLPDRFIKMNGDIRVIIPLLKELASSLKLKTKIADWLAEISTLKDLYGNEKFSKVEDSSTFLSIYDFVDYMSDSMSGGETIITGSSGLAVEVFYTHFRNKPKQNISLTTGLGAMGYGLPALLGASEATSDKVYLFESDGSLMMNLQELQSIKSRDKPVVIFIMNNNGYASIRATQSNYFQGRYVATGPNSGLEIPEIKKIADCFGFDFIKINGGMKVSEILDRVISWKGQLICEVVLLDTEVLLPKCGVTKRDDNTLVSAPLEDMTPLLPLHTLQSVMGFAFDKLSEDLRNVST